MKTQLSNYISYFTIKTKHIIIEHKNNRENINNTLQRMKYYFNNIKIDIIKILIISIILFFYGNCCYKKGMLDAYTYVIEKMKEIEDGRL